MAGNQIQFGIGFNVNESGLNKLKQSLQEIQKLTVKDLMGTGNFANIKQAEQTLNRVKASAQQVQTALTKAFNPSLGTTNIAKFNQEIQKLNVGGLATQFNQLGATGQAAFLQITQQALSLNAPLKQNVGWLQKMGQTITNQIKWHVASSAINGFTNSIQSAFNYVKALDSSLTDIRIVTGESRDEMARFALEANNAAQALGRQTKEYTNAALQFYQQGLNDQEVRTRTEATLKAQNITGAGTEIADELTAVWNGFQISIEETESAVDKLAAVADSSASNMSELATGMSKTASVANNMGVSIDQLTAQLATIIATTRQAPESVGNALKTIYTRINDISTGADDAEISLGNYSKKMAEVGINVLDTNGKLRSTGDVMTEIGSKWETMSHEQQIYLARTMAGQRQMNNLIALFDNWTKYSDMLNISLNAEGALNEKNARYMESLSAHINQFKAAMEGFQDSLLDQDAMISFYDAGTKFVEILDSFVNSIGGMKGALIGLGVIGVNAFKDQIAESITVAINNLRIYRQNLDQAKAQQEILRLFNTNQASYNGLAMDSHFKMAIDNLRQLKQELYEYNGVMTTSDQQAVTGLLEQKAAVDQTLLSYEELVEKAVQLGNAGLGLSTAYGLDAGENFKVSDIFSLDMQNSIGILSKDGEKNIQGLIDQLRFLKEEYSDFKNMASDLGGVLRSNQELTNKVKIQREVVRQLQEQWDSYSAGQKSSNTDIYERLMREKEALDQLEEEYNDIQQQIKEFKGVIEQAAEQENIFGENTQKVREQLALLGQPGQDDAKILSTLLGIFEQSGAAADKYILALRNLSTQLVDVNNKSEQVTIAFNQLKQSLQDAKIAQSLTNMLRGVSSLAMGVQSLSSAHKTYQEIQEGTIDSMEGWLRIIMSVSMALPMLTSGLKNIVTSIGPLVSGIGTAVTALGSFIGASSGVGAAITGIIGEIGTGILAFGAITVVIAAVVGGLILLYKHLTKNTKAYKESQKELEKLKNTYSETQASYKRLTDAIENYHSTQEALSKLTKGTEEWKDMIEQANNAVQELMEAFPELSSKVHFDENGNPLISDEDLNAAKINARRQQFISGAEVKRKEAENASLKIGSDAEGLQTAAWKTADEIEELARTMYSNASLRTFFTDIINNIENEIEESIPNSGTPEELAAFTAQTYLQALIDKGVVLPNEYVDLSEQIQEYLTLNTLKQQGKELSSEDVFKLNTYYNLIQDFLSDLNGFKVLGQKGTQIFDDLREEQIAQNGLQTQIQSLAMIEVMEMQTKNKNLAAALIAAQSEQITTVNELDNLVNTTEKTVNTLSKMFGGNQDLLNAIASFAGGRVGDLSNLTKEQIVQLRGVLQVYAQEFGFSTVQAVQEAFDGNGDDIAGAIAEWEQDFDLAIAKIPEVIRKSGEKIITDLREEDAITPDEAEAIGETLTKAARKGTTLQAFDLLTQIFQKLGKDAGDFATKLNNLDWSTLTLDQIQQLANELELPFDQIRSQIQEFINIVAEAANVNSFEDLANQYKKAKDVIDDLHYGDTIGAKDYEEGLKPYEDIIPGLRDMFTRMPTGEYYFKGDAEKLQQLFETTSIEAFNAALDTAITKLNELNQLPSFEELKNNSNNLSEYDLAQQRANYLRATGYDNLENLNAWNTTLQDEQATEEEINTAVQAIAKVFEDRGNQDESIESSKTAVEANLRDYQEASSFRAHEWDADVKQDDLEKRAEFLKEYAKELYGISQDLEDNHEAAMLIAEDFLRAEHAAKDVAENIDDWRKALDDPQKDISAYVDALESMENDYKDLLNLSQEAHLSSEFLNSAENLDLMEQAINGNIEAYQQLSDLAQQDILHQGIIDNTDGGMVIPATVDTTALEETLMTEINSLESMLEPIEIGTDLTGDDQLMAKFNEIINAAGLTADQATALLASMGVDAEVVEGPPIDSQNPSHYSWVDPAEYTIEQDGEVGDGAGGTFPHYSARLTKPATLETAIGTQTDTSPASFALHVESAKKGVGSGGNINHKKASGLGGGGGRKSGGGGGGSKPKQPKKTEAFKAKIDPYHDVNIKIGDTKEGLTKLEKQRDKLLGKDAITNLTKQINLLEREKELLQEKADIAHDELQKQADELAAHGAIIDSQGNILNYKELLLAKQEQINKAIEIANGLDADSQEAYLKYVEDLKKEYKELEEGIKNLDDTKQLLDDLGLDYQDLINEQIELAMEAFNLEIEVHLDTKDAQKEFNDFRKKVIDQVKDDQYGGLATAAARNYGLYFNNQGIGIVGDLQQHALQIQQEAEIIRNGGFSQIYGNNLAAAKEDLKKYNDELMKALEDAQDVIDETHDHFLNAIDAMNEAFDTQQENLDKIDDLLQHDMEILQLIHGEENYDEMELLWQQQVDQDNRRLEALQKEQEYWQKRVKQYAEGTDEWKKAMENWQDAFEKINEAMINSVKNLQAQWENSINKIFSQLRNATYGGNMTAALEDWDKMNWHSDRYLDSLERATGLLNLQGKYQDVINKTTNPKLQAKMAELEEKQLDLLSQKEHLREIDLKISEQQLAVLQAQMALEDAQQAKTKLRLRRDSQGNYTYQYVADEDDIEAKTQEYANVLAEYRQMVRDSLRDDLQNLSDYTQEFYDKMQEAQMKYGDDTEALMAEQARLYELYMGEDGYITRLAADAQYSMQDLQEATFIQAKGLSDLLNQDLFDKFLGPDAKMRVAIHELLDAGGDIPTLLDAFINDSALTAFDTISEACKETLRGPEGLLPEWESALWDIAERYEQDFVPRVLVAMNDLQYANQIYVDGLAIMQEAANRTTQQIALGLYADTAYTKALNDATNVLLQTQDAELQQAERVYDALMKNVDAYEANTAAAIDAANALFLYWCGLNGMAASGVPYGTSLSTGTVSANIGNVSLTSMQPSYSGGDYSGGGGGSGSGDYSNNNSTNQNSKTGSSYPEAWTDWMHQAPAKQSGIATKVQEQKNKQHFATGGYTGEWNDEPRLAWLDQKELVLNADDTKNMLSAVSIVRTIADKVANATNAATANIGVQGLGSLIASAGEQILQNVVINADFPAVQDAAQIKQAFNELVNLASQRASANRRVK